MKLFCDRAESHEGVTDDEPAQLPQAEFGKGCAKVKFGDQAAMPILFEACRKIVARNA